MKGRIAIAAALAASLHAGARAQSAAPCFEPGLGTNLALGDDAVAASLPLGFTFNGPGGAVTAISVSSNGFVWLGTNLDPGCCAGSPTALLAGAPRIAPLWTDLYPPGAGPGGGVFFNALSATATVPARAVVTWSNVPAYGSTRGLTVQLQLLASGEVLFHYDTDLDGIATPTLVGISNGGGASAHPLDLSAISPLTPHDTGNAPTAHELFAGVPDLGGRSYELQPNGLGGYTIAARAQCQPSFVQPFGSGCPRPATTYEYFAAPTFDLANRAILFTRNAPGGYTATATTGFFAAGTSTLPLTDDQLRPLPLPFTWPFPGGSTTQVQVDSNGALLLTNHANAQSRSFTDPFVFTHDQPSIAGFWADLDPSLGGSVSSAVDTINQAVHVTWANVPEHAAGGANTFQISLFANGDFRLAWQTCANLAHPALVGISLGAGFDPGSVDISTALPFSTATAGAPLLLAAAIGQRPALGQPFTLTLDHMAPGTQLCAMVFGLQRLTTPLDLSALGMPGCQGLTSADANVFFPLAVPPAPFTFTVPRSLLFSGYRFFAQGASLTPGVNALGIALSNGLLLQIGS